MRDRDVIWRRAGRAAGGNDGKAGVASASPAGDRTAAHARLPATWPMPRTSATAAITPPAPSPSSVQRQRGFPCPWR
ncbi:MAG TPA: hypothetical protein VGM12_25055 [Trebonia sp.]